VTIACASNFVLSEPTIPDDFPGAYYTYAAYPPDIQQEFQRITQSGSTTLIPPFSYEQVHALYDPTVSPDGRLMGEVASLQLTPDEIEYLISERTPYDRYHNKLTWRDSATLVIRFFDEDYPRPIRETQILVSQNPLQITRGVTNDIVYPELPVPAENRLRERCSWNSRSSSPTGIRS
jgi:hypothetical protein